MIEKLRISLKAYGLFWFLWHLSWEVRMRLKWALLKSYSQCGEDILIDKLLRNKRKGFYVDIGAYDPTRFSNTKRFYLRGWKGINIEPDPTRAVNFNVSRPKDINLNLGIANKKGELKFYIFNPSTLSTFSRHKAEDYQKQGFELKKTSKIKVDRLSNILKKYCKKSIDFFSIDTEGFDVEVLKSYDWDKFKPKVICIESSNKEIDRILSTFGYKKIYQTDVNSIFYYGKF